MCEVRFPVQHERNHPRIHGEESKAGISGTGAYACTGDPAEDKSRARAREAARAPRQETKERPAVPAPEASERSTTFRRMMPA